MATLIQTQAVRASLDSNRLAQSLPSLALLAVSYGFLFSARGWIQFFDESDNFLGGRLIAHGQTLYRDYFSHHMPLPYYLAAIPSLLGVSDLVGYRVFTSLIILTFWTFIVVRFRTRIAPAILSIFVLTVAVGCYFFLGNLLLAETFESYCLLIVCLYFYAFPSLDLGVADQLVVAAAVFIAAMCTLMSLYPLAVLLGYYVYRRASERRRADFGAFLRGEARFATMLVVPVVAVVILLAVTGTLTTFVQDAFVFNQVYYSKYALAGDPLRIAVTIVRDNYHLIRANLDPKAWQTVDGYALIANAAFFVLLVQRRGLVFAIGFAAVAATTRGRGESFHDQPYYLLSFLAVAGTVAAAVSILPAVVRRLGRALVFPGVIWRAGAVAGVGTYLLLAALFYGNLALQYPWRYQWSGDSGFREIVEATTKPGDKLWIVPLGFYDYLAIDRMPASRYAFYLPWLADSPAINAAILGDLAASRPPIIIYPQGYALIRWEAGNRQILALDQYGKSLRQRLSINYVVADETDPVLRGILLRKDLADDLRRRLGNGRLLNSGVEKQ